MPNVSTVYAWMNEDPENIGEPQIKIVWDDGYSEHKANDHARTISSTDNIENIKHNKEHNKTKIN